MLYPLSYEGLLCAFAQHAGLVSCRWSWVATSLRRLVPRLCRVRCGQVRALPRHVASIVRLVVPSQSIGDRDATRHPAALSHLQHSVDSEEFPWRAARAGCFFE
jgi:hypothetical protein